MTDANIETPDITKSEHEGYSQFVNEDGEEYGSFEVFWAGNDTIAEWNKDGAYEIGWYWWACFPGCLPDSEFPKGPFNTSKAAWDDAREDF